MPALDYFPLGIAKGDAFCNRIKERERLASNIKKGRHTLITSPRRYGKSSLALFVLAELGLPYERVDLFVAVNSKTVEEQILKGVNKLLNKISNTHEQTIHFIKNYIKKLKLQWMIGTDGINISLIPNKDSDSVNVILEALLVLENLLSEKKIRAVFFIDEFQEIGVLEDRGIEGAIRHVAQESKNISFIFSGSNRHILSNMFDSRKSPLYMLCDRISIERIAEEDYIHFINKIAKATWNKHLDQSIFDEIFKFTERHPYYMNVLCNNIWEVGCHKMPSKEQVSLIWREYIFQEESKIAKEMSALNLSQKKVLVAIAKGMTTNLTGKSALFHFNLTSGATTKILQQLKERDYIGLDMNKGYYVVDPAIKFSILLFYPDLYL